MAEPTGMEAGKPVDLMEEDEKTLAQFSSKEYNTFIKP